MVVYETLRFDSVPRVFWPLLFGSATVRFCSVGFFHVRFGKKFGSVVFFKVRFGVLLDQIRTKAKQKSTAPNSLQPLRSLQPADLTMSFRFFAVGRRKTKKRKDEGRRKKKEGRRRRKKERGRRKKTEGEGSKKEERKKEKDERRKKREARR